MSRRRTHYFTMPINFALRNKFASMVDRVGSAHMHIVTTYFVHMHDMAAQGSVPGEFSTSVAQLERRSLAPVFTQGHELYQGWIDVRVKILGAMVAAGLIEFLSGDVESVDGFRLRIIEWKDTNTVERDNHDTVTKASRDAQLSAARSSRYRSRKKQANTQGESRAVTDPSRDASRATLPNPTLPNRNDPPTPIDANRIEAADEIEFVRLATKLMTNNATTESVAIANAEALLRKASKPYKVGGRSLGRFPLSQWAAAIAPAMEYQAAKAAEGNPISSLIGLIYTMVPDTNIPEVSPEAPPPSWDELTVEQRAAHLAAKYAPTAESGA